MEPWTRSDIIDLCVLALLLVWFFLDRCNVYFIDEEDETSGNERTP